MKRFWCLAVLLLSLPAATLSAASKEERLITPPLLDFIVVHSEVGPRKSVTMAVPDGETIDDWTRMVRTQRFRKLADRMSPVEYVNRMHEILPKNCEGALASPVESLRIAGRDAARFKVICPVPIMGKAESFVLLAIAGKQDMYVEQIAFMGKATSEDFLWARKFLEGVFLCTPGSDASVCQ